MNRYFSSGRINTHRRDSHLALSNDVVAVIENAVSSLEAVIRKNCAAIELGTLTKTKPESTNIGLHRDFVNSSERSFHSNRPYFSRIESEI